MISHRLSRGDPLRRRAGGFTLVELLVVVAILTILIALLMPVLRRSRDVAMRALCASNLHQLHVATIAYATDMAGKVPQTGGTQRLDFWYSSFADTLRNSYLGGHRGVMACPTMPALTEDEFLYSAHSAYPAPASHSSTYRVAWYIGTNNRGLDPARYVGQKTADLDGDGKPDNLSVQRLADPSDRVLYFDDVWINSFGLWQDTINAIALPGVPHVDLSRVTTHGAPPEGSNHVLLGGSVGWTPFDQMQPIYTYSGSLFDSNRDVWW